MSSWFWFLIFVFVFNMCECVHACTHACVQACTLLHAPHECRSPEEGVRFLPAGITGRCEPCKGTLLPSSSKATVTMKTLKTQPVPFPCRKRLGAGIGPSSEIPASLSWTSFPAICNSAQTAHGFLVSGKVRVPSVKAN